MSTKTISARNDRPPATRPWRTAIIGFGNNGEYMHARPINDSDAFELRAVADINEARRPLATNEFGAAFYSDYRAMLDQEDLDLVCVISRSDLHVSMACDCLEAGCHVLVTKPWALNASEAERMIACARKSGKQLLPWLPVRWGAETRELKAIVDSGRIGKVFLVRRAASSFHIRSDWQAQKKYGGGYLLNWGPHLVESAYWILGRRVKSVSGFLKQTLGKGDAEDVFFATLTLDNGAVALVEYTMSAVQLPNWVIQGDEGTIVVKETADNARDIQIARIDAGQPVANAKFISLPIVDEKRPGQDSNGDPRVIYADVARALQGETVPGFDLDSALHLTRVLDAIRLSHETGQTISL